MTRFVRVARGDHVAGIAARHGFQDWQKIWDHPENEALRRRRKSPHVLFEGDTIALPDLAPKEVEVPTGEVSTFRVRLAEVPLKLVLKDRSGAAVASRDFELSVDGATKTGTTTGEGLVDVTIPATARHAELRLQLDGGRVLRVPIAIGHLDPVDEAPGVKQRLRNLGYLRQRAPDDDDVREALCAFQADRGLPVTGEADEETRDRMRLDHGS